MAGGGGGACEAALLDWLCVHVEPGALPRRFAGAARSLKAGAGIKVVAKADEEAAAARRCAGHTVQTTCTGNPVCAAPHRRLQLIVGACMHVAAGSG